MQRIIAGVLAVSGAIFVWFAWILPLFWPGYLVWVGWIVIALSSKGAGLKWFWMLSALWNAGVLWIFISGADSSPKNAPFILWHTRLHSFIAVLASVYLCFRETPLRSADEKKPNKAPEPTPMSVTSPAAQEPRQP